MISVRMAVFDLDGTLLDHGRLTREAVDMLQALRRGGVLVVIATGRHRGTVPVRLKSPRLTDYLICTNGAVVTPTGGTLLREQTLSAEELRALMDLGKAFDCRYSVSLGRTTYMSKRAPLRRRMTDWQRDVRKYLWRYYMYPLHSRMVRDWDAFLDGRDARAEKVICTTRSEQEDKAFCALVEADGRFTVTGSNQAVEVTARGTSKGSALAYLADTLHISRDAIVAFGNDDNDLSMQAHAGRFVAVSASSPAALQAADQVTDSIPQAALDLCLGMKD